MGKQSRNFRLKGNNKRTYVKKQRYDYSQFKGRIIGYLPDGYPVIGSESQLIKPLTNKSLSPLELKNKKEDEYIKREMLCFKKYMRKSNITVW